LYQYTILRGETMANQECLNYIGQGAMAWNNWRNSHEMLYLDLSGADLSRMDLRSVDLSNVHLHMANLSGTDLSGANLCRAYLEGAKLSDALLNNADVSTANLHVASLIDANLDGANLSDADLREAQMQRASARRAIFSGANLSDADLSETILSGAQLSKCLLHNVRLHEAQLNGADLSYCDLTTLDLENVDLHEANLREVDLTGVNLSGANLRRASLDKATLRGASFYGATLDGARLEAADLSTAYLGGAHLKLTNLHGADLSFVDLSGATLFLADLSNADLTRANFTRAILDEADFTRATLGWTIFGSVNLSAVKGLDSISHHGALVLDIETLLRSARNLPASFLQAANLAPDIIASLAKMPSLDPYTWCICASSLDHEFVTSLHASLQKKGIRCWYVLVDQLPEEKQQEHLDELIRLHDQLLLVCSKHSVSNDWMRYVVETVQRCEQRENKKLLQLISLDYAVIKSQEDWAVNMQQEQALVDVSMWQQDSNSYGRVVNHLVKSFREEYDLPEHAISRSKQLAGSRQSSRAGQRRRKRP
jgi:uncharacterized protein YjbI with pentapeptide repeats